jgi:NADPH:quinone reductase-like Zn-dependent oxidoreductase
MLPLIPGTDGVGRLPDGTRVFFTTQSDSHGSMAERVAVPTVNCIAVPEGLDDVLVAAAMNPAMSCWHALRTRGALQPGERVLVLGATGNAGQAAVQLARHLGAATVIGAGRNQSALEGLSHLGADSTVSLEASAEQVAHDLAAAAADIDVVVDYLWGAQTELALSAIIGARRDSAHPLRWVQVGAVAGPTITLPAATLRKTAVQILGSGMGSVSEATMNHEVPELLQYFATTEITAHPIPTSLRCVEDVWNQKVGPGRRIVFVP